MLILLLIINTLKLVCQIWGGGLESVSVSKLYTFFCCKFTNFYLQANCLLECTAAAMLQLCGCVPYFYPAFPQSFIDKNVKLSNYKNSTGFCFFENLLCLSKNRGKASLILCSLNTFFGLLLLG